MNLQESEPVLYSDEWLVKENAENFNKLYELLLDSVFDVIVIGSKEKYREKWTANLEKVTGGKVFSPEDLPMNVGEELGVVFGYTEDVYDYSEELSLLKVTTGTVISPDLPTQHGWITHNTETTYNIYKALFEGKPVTKKHVHISGEVPQHKCLKTPIGTTTSELLQTIDLTLDDLGKNQILLEGGPGWCSDINYSPSKFGVSKRTNAILITDYETAEQNREKHERERINLLKTREWETEEHEKEPTEIKPNTVRIPLISNKSLRGTAMPSNPIVSPGDRVSEGDVIATPNPRGHSIPQHASINGEVTHITDSQIIINRRETY